MQATNPYQQYVQNAVMSADPGQLTLMLYNGALKFVKQGIQAIENKDIPGAHEALVRAQEIVAYLNDTLDHKYELAGNLASLYDFLLRRLMIANIRKDKKILEDEVLPLLTDLRDTWMEVLKRARQVAVAGPA